MSSAPRAWKRRAAALLAEPTVWFFVVGALLFVAQRLRTGDPRLVVVTPGVKAELTRQFRDTHGRAPTPADLAKELRTWERDEALFREALRDRLDRNDRTVRTALADKLRARVAVGLAKRQPTAADLDTWLAAHRSLYESPRRYDYGAVAFPKPDAAAAADLAKYERALATGADARTLGRPIVGGNLTADELRQRLGPALAASIVSLPIGRWQPLQGPDALLLVRLNGVEGGLPEPQQLKLRLLADWQYEDRQRELDAALQVIVDRYHFEERPQ